MLLSLSGSRSMHCISKILKNHSKHLLALLCTWGAYFVFLFSKMIYFKPDGLWVGHQHVWSDWSLHIAIANIFAFKSPHLWFAYHPIYAGGKLTYPWLADFISGMCMRLHVSLPLAFIIPSIITS